MKIVALCDFPYWKGDLGTAIRYMSLCEQLSEICDLTVLATVPLGKRYQSLPRELPYQLIDGPRLEQLHREIGAPSLPGTHPDRMAHVSAIRHICESRQVDAVLTPYFNRHWMIAPLSPQILRIIDTHDCQHQRMRSFSRHGLVSTFLMTPEREGAELSRYDIALAMSDEDQAAFGEITDIPLVTAPFRLPVKDIAPMRSIYRAPNGNPELLFVAAQSPVNEMTLQYLVRDILPLVPRQLTLNVIGNVHLPATCPGNVTLVHHQDLDDLRPLYARSDLALNPTYAGGGVKTKTLEALAYGVPIITSDEGARGLRHLIPDELVVNDKERFAHTIDRLIADPDRRAALSREIISRQDAEDVVAWARPLRHLVRAMSSARQEGSA